MGCCRPRARHHHSAPAARLAPLSARCPPAAARRRPPTLPPLSVALLATALAVLTAPAPARPCALLFALLRRRRSGLYKPPRSHFDSVTERLTLNMDHFCPWVINTVGFYNRKFFMLFLVYANLTCCFMLVALVAQAPTLWPWLNSDEGERQWFAKTFNIVIYCAAAIVDAVVLCLIGPFAGYHLKMAARNETTIEGASNVQYDVGTMQNLRSVFGRSLWTWPIPLYFRGPDGDGIRWPRSDAQVATTTSSSARGALTVSPAATANSAAVEPASDPAP